MYMRHYAPDTPDNASLFVRRAPKASRALLRRVLTGCTRKALRILVHTAHNAPRLMRADRAADLRWCALYGPQDRSWFARPPLPNLYDMAHSLGHDPHEATGIAAKDGGRTPCAHPQYRDPPEGSAL